MESLVPHGLQIWTDYEGDGGTHLHTVVDAERIVVTQDLDGEETLDLHLPRSSDAWTHLARRRVLRLRYTDGTIWEYRIARVGPERHRDGELRGDVVAEGPLYELRRLGLCERVEADGSVRHDFELLALTATEHLNDAILPVAPAFFALGTIDPTEQIDLHYERLNPLAALQQLVQLTATEIELTRAGGGIYSVHLRDQVGATATVPRVWIGKNATGVQRTEDDRETVTRVYPVGQATEDGQAVLADARWPVTARDTGADWIVCEVAHRGVTINPAALWDVDDGLNGLYVGLANGTAIQEILDTVRATGRIFVADASLYAIGAEVAFYRTVGGERLTYLEDRAAITGNGDRRPEPQVYDDVPPARNLAPNPRLDRFTAGAPDAVSAVGTPTTFAEYTAAEFSEIGRHALRIVADAADEGATTDTFTIRPTALKPYFSAWAKFYLVSGKVRFELVHVIATDPVPPAGSESRGVLPPENGKTRAISSRTGWNELVIELGEDHLLPAGTLQLRILSEGGPAEWYLDAWQCTNTGTNFPFYDGDPAVELFRRAVNRFQDEQASQPRLNYELTMVDLSETIFPYDGLTLGGTVAIRDDLLGIATTERITRIARELPTGELVRVTLADRRGALTDFEITRRKRRDLRGRPEETLILLKFVPYLDANGHLWIDYAGATNVTGLRWDVSTTSQPSRTDAIAGTLQVGRSGRFSTGIAIATGNAIFVTVVPVGEGKQGPTYEWTSFDLGARPSVLRITLALNGATGAVNARVEANALALSYRYATAVGVDPAWPLDTAVEAGTVRTFTAGVDAFDLGAGTVPLGQILRIRVAPYTKNDGTGPGGATDHGTIQSEQAYRAGAPEPTLELVSVVPGVDGVTGGPNVDVGLKIVDPLAVAGNGELRVWTNKGAIANPNAAGAHEGDVAVAAGTVDSSTVFDLNPGPGTGTLLQDIKVPGDVFFKLLFAEWIAADGRSTGQQMFPVNGKEPLFDENSGKPKRGTKWNDDLYVTIASDVNGRQLPATVRQFDGGVPRVIAKGHVTGEGQDGDAVVFGDTFASPPYVALRGGIGYEPRSGQWSGTYSTTLPQYRDLEAVDVSVSGFDIRARLRQKAATSTSRTADFPAGNTLDAVAETAEANLTNAPSATDQYTVNYDVDFTMDALGVEGYATVVVAIDSNDGAGWVERVAVEYTAFLDDGASSTAAWPNEARTIAVTGLGADDDVRVRVKSRSSAGGLSDGDWSFVVHGHNAGTDLDSPAGVTYSTATDSFATMTPDAEDVVTYDVLGVST